MRTTRQLPKKSTCCSGIPPTEQQINTSQSHLSEMAPYDSDSSGAEDGDFEETNVLLGYASPDANGEEISRLGGQPDWLDPSNPPSASLARCKICKEIMVLLLQLNAELPEKFPGHERRIYVLSCKNKKCRRKEGSIRAVRGLRISEQAVTLAATKAKEIVAAPSPPTKASQTGLGEALFGVKPATSSGSKANPFASGNSNNNPFAPKPATSTTTTTNPFAPAKPVAAEPPEATEEAVKTLPKTFAETLSLNNPQVSAPPPSATREPWPETKTLPEPYPIKWIADAEYETLDLQPTPLPHANAQVMDIDNDNSSGAGGGKEDKEVFESSHDSVFQKFADRIGQNPEQCIRYEFNGQPLLYSKSDTVGKLLYSGSEKVGPVKGIPRCNNCGAGRVFEVQLAPQAIQELESEIDDMDGMDWGTIIVGVCDKDCQEKGIKVGEAGYVEEWAGVQWEELSVKR